MDITDTVLGEFIDQKFHSVLTTSEIENLIREDLQIHHTFKQELLETLEQHNHTIAIDLYCQATKCTRIYAKNMVEYLFYASAHQRVSNPFLNESNIIKHIKHTQCLIMFDVFDACGGNHPSPC